MTLEDGIKSIADEQERRMLLIFAAKGIRSSGALISDVDQSKMSDICYTITRLEEEVLNKHLGLE